MTTARQSHATKPLAGIGRPSKRQGSDEAPGLTEAEEQAHGRAAMRSSGGIWTFVQGRLVRAQAGECPDPLPLRVQREPLPDDQPDPRPAWQRPVDAEQAGAIAAARELGKWGQEQWTPSSNPPQTPCIAPPRSLH
jgi:hypothetical protein